jgi:hypothetical protein
MKLTTNHTQSSYNLPVFLTDAGEVIDYAPAIADICDALGSGKRLEGAEKLAEICGASDRTVQGWIQGRLPSKPCLMLLQIWLNSHK